MSIRKRLVLLPALLASASASAQELQPVLRVGGAVEGEIVSTLISAIVDDDGSWSALVELWPVPYVFPHPNAVVRDGEILVRSGTVLPGGEITRILDIFGSSAHVALVFSEHFGPLGVARDARVLFQPGEPVHVQGLPPDATLAPFGGFQGYGGDEDTLVMLLRLETNETAVVRVELSQDGVALSRTADLVSGALLPDGARVLEIQSTLRVPVNARGEWLSVVRSDDGEQRLVSPHAVLLKTGTPSPVPGRTLEELDAFEGQDNNDLGGLVATVRLSGDPATDQLLIKNSAPFAQEGEWLPALAPHRLVAIGPPQLDNSGAVVWGAVTDAPAGHDVALMRDHQPLIVVGSTRVAGRLVERIDRFHVSPSGRYWIAGVMLEGFYQPFLVRADLGSAVPLPGCTPNPATLRGDGGLVLAGRTVELVMDGPVPFGSLARLHFAVGSAGPLDCGRATAFGELFVDPARLVAVLPGGTFANQPVRISLAIPPDPALVDLALVAQGSFAHPNGLVLTNGLALAIGAP